MRPLSRWFGPTTVAAALLAAGALLMLVAYLQASTIPLQAHDDYGVLIRAQGGSLSHSANYPDVYRQLSANRRMLQNVYLGGAGLVLVGAGSYGLVLRRPVPAGRDAASPRTT
jgi:hypothetical protein